MNTATEITKALVPVMEGRVDGRNWLSFRYDGSYEAYKSMPNILMYQNVKYLKMGHNSDSGLVAYKQLNDNQIATW
jgi:hypothetical protein